MKKLHNLSDRQIEESLKSANYRAELFGFRKERENWTHNQLSLQIQEELNMLDLHSVKDLLYLSQLALELEAEPVIHLLKNREKFFIYNCIEIEHAVWNRDEVALSREIKEIRAYKKNVEKGGL